MSQATTNIEQNPEFKKLTGFVFLIGFIFSAYQIAMAAYHPLSSQIVRVLHVGFLLLMIFVLYAPKTPQGSVLKHPLGLISYVAAFLGFTLSLYHWYFEPDLVARAGEPTMVDTWVGAIIILLVFEAARRVMGFALPLICASFFLYALFGQQLPGIFVHRGYPLEQLIDHLGFGTEGIYGIPTYVSSSYIFLFILFGSFLEQAGMIKLFTDFAMGTVGHTRGGPAKVSVVASGLMGTINGSGVANVVTTGQFTIPMMKRFGYKPAFAGGVEATSSMGGQIMPPVMGAVAFIMAETIGVQYIEIVQAALVPAILYFVTAFWMVHLEAGRLNLVGLPKSECPNPWKAVKESWYLLFPLVILVFLLFTGYTPLFSGMVGLALTAILILGAAIALKLKGIVMRYVFWVALGIFSASFFKWGVTSVLIIIAAMLAVLFFIKGGRDTIKLLTKAMVEGAHHALPVGIACALVGVIIGVLTLTGAATTFASAIISVGENSLIASLLLTMLVCLILGMGIPTIPNYIITSSLAAPALLELGVPLIVSHMFVFYFGIMADLTPPVALAAFAAAPIAGVSGLKISIQAVRIAFAGFVIPFMAVYSPALMLQNDPTIWAVIYIVLKALIAIGLWGIASVGFMWNPVNAWVRIWALLSAALLIAALPLTDELGLLSSALVFAWLYWQHRKIKAHASTRAQV
jgi:TRAP transporter 4TM/12TM fusion protein